MFIKNVSNFTAVCGVLMVAVVLVVVMFTVAAKPVAATVLEVPLLGPDGPVSEVSGIGDYISAVFDFSLLVVGIIAVIMIIIGGYQYLTSAANPQLVSSAKETITSAIIGLVMVLLSALFAQTLSSALVQGEIKIPGIDLSSYTDPLSDGSLSDIAGTTGNTYSSTEEKTVKQAQCKEQCKTTVNSLCYSMFNDSTNTINQRYSSQEECVGHYLSLCEAQYCQ